MFSFITQAEQFAKTNFLPREDREYSIHELLEPKEYAAELARDDAKIEEIARCAIQAVEKHGCT